MESASDVMIVSAFGRGHWLAAELATNGFSVVLIDVTESIGRWTPEDWEGPFGFFQPDSLTGTQKSSLVAEGDFEEIESGFTVWSPEGPIEGRGQMIDYWLKNSQPVIQADRYFKSLAAAQKGDKKADERDDVLAQPFSKNWLVHLLHQVASPEYHSNSQSIQSGDPLPIFSTFSVRRVSRRGYEQSLKWCQSQGVKVFRQAMVRDLLIESRSISGLEIKSDWSGALLGKQLVWSLTSQETQKLSDRVAELLFPIGTLTPEWSWLRYRFSLKLSSSTEALPHHLVMINDNGLPWSHSNLLIMQRDNQRHEADVWIRIPSHHRFQRSYLETMREEVSEVLARRIPDCDPAVIQMPQDYFYEYSELGPSAFAVYEPKSLKSLTRLQLRNLIFDGPECWASLEWSGRLRYQAKVLDQVKAIKEQELKQLEQNQEGKDQESDRTLYTP